MCERENGRMDCKVMVADQSPPHLPFTSSAAFELTISVAHERCALVIGSNAPPSRAMRRFCTGIALIASSGWCCQWRWFVNLKTQA